MTQEIKQLAFFRDITIKAHTELSGGKCNRAIRITTEEHGDLVCVIQANAPDIERQLSIHQSVSELKTCPPILANEIIGDQHFTVMKYIKGRHQSGNLWRREKRQAFAKQLVEIHQLYHDRDAQWPTLDLSQHILNYQNQLSPQNQALNRQSIDYVLPKLAELNDPVLGLCHHDLNPKNLLTESDQRIIVLDWEYAAISDVYFDLACFTIEHQLTAAQTDQWLSDYWQAYNQTLTQQQQPHQLDITKFKLYQQCYKLVCDLWHQIYR